MNSLLRSCQRFAWISLAVLASSCAGPEITPPAEFRGDMVVVTDYAPFFRLGPQQAGGPNLSLRAGERVMLLRKEFGYSRVQLDDKQIGYMANEDIQPAPPEPTRRPERDAAVSGRRGASRVVYDGPPPDFSLPDPDLNIAPEEIPVEPLPPLPEMLPEPPAPPSTPAPTPKPSPTPKATPAPSPAA